MNDVKHTPGPWAWYGPTRGEGLTFTHEAHVGPGPGNDSAGPIAAVGGDDAEQAVANARLISAAPDLLSEAKKSLAFVKHTLEFFGWGQFPSLEEEVRRLEASLTATVAKAGGS